MMALFTLGALGGSVALFATASTATSPSGSRVGGIVVAVIAVLFAGLTYLIWRRGRPRQCGHLRLLVEPIEVRRGDTVRATLTITDVSRVGEHLELGLVCTEYWDDKVETYNQYGSQTSRVTKTADAAKAFRPAQRIEQQTMEFQVPPESPFSYEGSAVSWAWHVSVVDRREHRVDPRRDVSIWVSP